MRLKTEALRRKTWFRALSRIERSIVDLTIQCVERVRSRTLAKVVLKILDKLLKTLEEVFIHRAEKIGLEIAQRLSEIALKWGNRQVWVWKYDLRFATFLGVNALNM